MSETNPEAGAARWRVFCAVELPEDVRRQAAARIAHLRANAPHVKAGWDRPEKLHLTLKFIGEIEPRRTHDLALALEATAGGAASFEISIEGAGVFPPKGAPRVLWLGVNDRQGGLARLHRQLEDECVQQGFPREQRAFRPHLTIARLRAPTGARELATLHQKMPFVTDGFRVGEIVLMRSELGPGGSRYTPLSRHPLQ